MTIPRTWLIVLALLGAFACGSSISGCSTRPMMTQEEQQANRERESIERPARPIDEETSLADRIGQVGVVILVVGITLAGILVPILLI
jgi:hypothetical protein